MPSTNKKNTRERLLAASLKEFGNNDYQAVSTRKIVKEAKANISAISYHFGGKEQLYLATAEYLALSISSNLQAVVDDVRKDLDTSNKQDCLNRLEKLIHAFTYDILDGDLSADASGFIFREQLCPTKAFDILYRGLIEPMQQIFAELVSCTLKKPLNEKALKLMTHSLLGQIIVFRVAQTTILKRLDISRFTATDIKQIATQVTQNTLAAIHAQHQ